MKKNILIAGASSGWGHIQAARNIDNAISLVQSNWAVRRIDVFDYLPLSLGLISDYGWRFASRYSSRLYSKAYRYFLGDVRPSQTYKALVRITARRIVATCEHATPDIVIATHSFAASVGSVLKERFNCKLIVVATDFVVHSMQMRPNVDFLCVPPGYECSSELGFHEGTILETGIPISSQFAIQKDARGVRKRLGLSEDVATVLVSFGGSGLRADAHVQLFADLLALNLPLQFVVLAGRNAKFAKALRELSDIHKRKHTIKVYDFVDEVSDFYAVADIFIGKAGGLSVSEALAVGLPIIIIDFLPGQEEWNVKMLTSNGLGTHVSNTTELGERIESLRGKIMASGRARRLHEFARPLSSQTVAMSVASLTT